MAIKIYLSPSIQTANGNKKYNYVEAVEMNLLTDCLVPVLNRCGIDCRRNRLTMSMSEIIADSDAYAPNLHLALHSNAHASSTVNKTGRGAVAYVEFFGYGAEAAARSIIAQMNAIQPFSNRSREVVANSALIETRKTKASAVLLEVDFHDNEGALWIQQNRSAIAEAICRGICERFGIDYREPQSEAAYGSSDDVKVRIEKIIAELMTIKEAI